MVKKTAVNPKVFKGSLQQLLELSLVVYPMNNEPEKKRSERTQSQNHVSFHNMLNICIYIYIWSPIIYIYIYTLYIYVYMYPPDLSTLFGFVKSPVPRGSQDW